MSLLNETEGKKSAFHFGFSIENFSRRCETFGIQGFVDKEKSFPLWEKEERFSLWEK